MEEAALGFQNQREVNHLWRDGIIFIVGIPHETYKTNLSSLIQFLRGESTKPGAPSHPPILSLFPVEEEPPRLCSWSPQGYSTAHI